MRKPSFFLACLLTILFAAQGEYVLGRLAAPNQYASSNPINRKNSSSIAGLLR